MSVLLETVTFTDVLGHHTISLEKVDVREIDPLSKVPASLEAWMYRVTEFHHSIYKDGATVTSYHKTVTFEALTEEIARAHFTRVYREQSGKETLTGITNFAVKAIGSGGNSVSVELWGSTKKTIVMTTRAHDSLCKLSFNADVFDVEFLYYTNTSIADDVIVITAPTN